MAYSRDDAQAFFDAAKTAYLNALTSKSYNAGDKGKQNQDIESLKKDMEYWKRILDDIDAGGTGSTRPRVKRGIPRV